MIGVAQYRQIEFEAALPDGYAPTLLDADKMVEKLKELQVAPNSPLHTHAMKGGPLYSLQGCYRLATAENVAKYSQQPASTAEGDTVAAASVVASAAPVPRTLLDAVADAYCGTQAPIAASAGSVTPEAAAVADERPKTLLEEAVAAYCASGRIAFSGAEASTSPSSAQHTPMSDAELQRAAADAFCGK